MTDRELMQQALDALESSRVFVTSRETIKHPEGTEWYNERIEALRARLAQPKPEPLWIRNEEGKLELHAPPQREWQGLTDEEMEEAMKYWSDPCRSAYGGAEAADDEYVDMIGTWRYIEAKLKEKNHG